MAGNHMSEMSPRQRMINMMYLVLTALLALNVSKEVLDAFFRVDQSLTQTVKEKEEDNRQRYASFSAKAKKNPAKIARWDTLAQKLNKETAVITRLLDSVRFELWAAGSPEIDGKAINLEKDEKYGAWWAAKSLKLVEQMSNNGKIPEIMDKANTVTPTNMMIDPSKKKPNSDGTFGVGIKIKQAIDHYRDFLLTMDVFPLKDSTYQAIVKDLFNTDNVLDEEGKEKDWITHNYYDFPLVGVLTFLNQTALDVRTAEDVMLSLLEQKTGESIVSIDKQIPYGLPKKSYMMTGDQLEISLLLAGIDTKTTPVYSIFELDPKLKNPDTNSVNFNKPLPKGTTWEVVDGKYIFKWDKKYMIKEDLGTNADGMAIYTKKMKKRGKNTVGGFVSVVSAMADDGYFRYPWATEIIVESPMSVISPTKLNAIYMGIDNDFSIAVPGYDPSQIQLKSSSGGVSIKSKGGGTYKITASKKLKGKTIELYVTAKGAGKVGKAMPFKVYDLPPSIATIDGRYKGDFKASRADVANMVMLKAKKDPSFVYNCKYSVRSFTLTYPNSRGEPVELKVRGGQFNSQVKAALKSVKSGRRISFSKIETVVTQNGKPVKGISVPAGSINVTVK